MVDWYIRKQIEFIACWSQAGFQAALFSSFWWLFMFTCMTFELISIILVILMKIQRREYPFTNCKERYGKNAIFGVFQPFADEVRIALRSQIIPKISLDGVWILMALFSFFVAILIWNFRAILLFFTFFSTKFAIFYIYLLFLYHVSVVLYDGWNSKFVHAKAQIIVSAELFAYDLVLLLAHINFFVYVRDFDLNNLPDGGPQVYTLYFLPVQTVTLFIVSLVQTNKYIFDLSDVKSQLDAGFKIKYLSERFVTFFLAEYSFILFLSISLNAASLDSINNAIGLFALIFWCIKIGIIAYCIYSIRSAINPNKYYEITSVCLKFLIPIQSGFLFLGVIVNLF